MSMHVLSVQMKVFMRRCKWLKWKQPGKDASVLEAITSPIQSLHHPSWPPRCKVTDPGFNAVSCKLVLSKYYDTFNPGAPLNPIFLYCQRCGERSRRYSDFNCDLQGVGHWNEEPGRGIEADFQQQLGFESHEAWRHLAGRKFRPLWPHFNDHFLMFDIRQTCH